MLSWGTMPGALQQILIASLNPVLDYRKILRGFRASVLSSEKTLTRLKPSRRYGFLYMGKKNRFSTRLLLGVDVSGSISDKDIQMFYSAINRFFKYGIEAVDALQFDADIKGEPLPMKKARRAIQVLGRGGTNFQPLIDFFTDRMHGKEARQRRTAANAYDGLIIFTDGFAPEPSVPRPFARKILWICNTKDNFERHNEWMCKLGRCCWIE
jgi:predicted metal-dependent peptidase